jgi:hypothetical protein
MEEQTGSSLFDGVTLQKPEAKGRKKRQDGPKPASLHEAGLETFVVREVDRSEIKNAEYNPRVMTDQERGKLKLALRKHGLVAPITWNARTGRIVGGHQRLSIMDALMQTKSYKLNVAAVDVDEAQERELNILLNNQAAQGQFDLAALKELFADPSVTLEGAGFDISDMVNMFGDAAFDESRTEDLGKLAERLSELSSHYSAVQKHNVQKQNKEFYLVFVFPDGEDPDRIIEAMGWKPNRYQSGSELMRLLKVSKESA